jgi:hypothetical protein
MFTEFQRCKLGIDHNLVVWAWDNPEYIVPKSKEAQSLELSKKGYLILIKLDRVYVSQDRPIAYT